MKVFEIRSGYTTCACRCYINDQRFGKYPKDRPLPKCGAWASISVEGTPYCRRHAAYVLLELLLRENRNEPERVSRETGAGGTSPVNE
jgi:hypothetical protein